MKIFGKLKEHKENGYQVKYSFFWLPIIKKIRDNTSRRVYLFGIKLYHKKFPLVHVTPNIQSVVDDSSHFITEILNKALEKNLREMKLFEQETKERLAKIEKKLK